MFFQCLRNHRCCWRTSQGRLSNGDENTLCLQRFLLLNKRVALSSSISSGLRPAKDKVLCRNRLNTPSYCSFKKSEKSILRTCSVYSLSHSSSPHKAIKSFQENVSRLLTKKFNRNRELLSLLSISRKISDAE